MKKITLLLLCFLFSYNFLRSQCTAPSFTVDLSAQADTTWTLVNETRGGVCCGSSNCVTFNVTTNPNTELISFDVTNPSPSGSAFYQVNCGTPVSIGTPLCIVGLPSPFTITYCKPGGDRPDYVITAGTVVHASDDISIQKTSCVDTLTVSNVTASSVVWTSIFPGTQGAYNSYLSCTSGCTSTLVTPGPNPPPYVDFMVSGTPNTNCGASFDRDTVRVYFVPNLTGTITPTNPIICASSGTQITLTANVSGGAPAYNYNWNPGGGNNASVTVTAAGTYSVVIGDKTKCPKITLTKTISTLPSATFSFSGGSYCKNGTNPLPVYSGNGQPGSFSASPAGLVFVSTSTGEVNLSASAPGTYTVTNFIAASNGCPNVSATSTITINPFPVMTSASTATICTGSPVSINLSSSSAATYTWIASDNINTTGESLTTQNTATLSNTIVNGTTVNQVVIYTVTPTSTLAGACVGSSQTVSVTVRPMDNAAFTYNSSTFCQTGTYPTPTVTGLSGGTFSGSSGLVFVNTSSGTINLSSTPVGTYTVTYTTNGPCPNTSTFPVTITLAPSAVFSFNGNPYCNNATNPFPTFGSGASGGTFTSQPGLVFVNTSTGEVDLSASTPGTYTVTNNIPAQAGCSPATATGTITITELKDPTFSYPGSPFCKNAANPSPTFGSGALAGVFSSQAGLSINSGNGAINLGASTAGTYTVTNTIAAIGGCPAVTHTAVVTITPIPIPTFTYTGTPYCNNGSNPIPTFTGGGMAGVFSGSSVFVNIDPSTGIIDLSTTQPGSYTVTNTIPAANGCPLVSASVPITITPLPIATFSFTANPYCQNAADPTPVLVTNGTNGIYTASPAGLSINSSAGTVDLDGSTPGTYTVTNTIAAASGCPAVVATNTITITALPIGTFTYSGTPYCINASNPSPTFTGGGTAGTFSSQAGLSINPTTGQVTVSTSTPGTYTVSNSIAAAGGCPVVLEQAVITILPMDDPGFNYPGSTFCQTGIDPTPNVTGLPGGVFASTSLPVNASTGVINLGTSSLGTFTVSYTTNGACPNTSTVNVTVSNAPSAVFSYSASPFCSSDVNPNPSFPPGASGGIYSSASGLVIDTLTGTVDLGASAAGTYTVTNTIAASGGCATAVATAVIQIDSAAIANASIDQTICYGSSVTLNGNVHGGATSGTWSGGNGTFLPGAGTLNGTYVPTAVDSLNGVITLTLTTNEPAGVCSAVSDVMSIAINQPATSNANTDQTICYGTSVILNGTIGGSAGGGTWSGGTGTFSPNDSTLNATYVPTAADSTAGNVTLTLSTNDPAGVCPMVSDAVTIFINQPATVNANVNQAICYGNPVILAGSVGGSVTGGTWSGGNGNFSPNTTTLNGTYTPTQADSASGISVLVLTSDDPAGVCPALSDTMIVNINQPALADAGTNALVCYGTNVVLGATIGGSASNATWTGGNGTYTPNDSTLTATYIPNAADSAAGTITLTLTTNDPAGVCPLVSDAITITIDQPATANANNDQNICYGTTVILAGSFGGSATGITWTGGNGVYSPNANTTGATYSPNSADSTAGTITLVLTTNDPTGVCPAVSDTMQVVINQPATASANNDQTLCFGSTVVLAGTIGGSATGGTWTGGNGTYSPNANTPGATYTPTSADSAAGTISLVITTNDPAGICPAVNDTMQITLNQPATVNANVNQTICYGSSVNLSGSIGGSATSGTWSGGNGSFTPNATTLNGVYVPTAADSAAGTITLTLTTDDPSGVCNAANDVMTITISQPATVNANADQVICNGSVVTLNGSVGGSATGGAWSGGGGIYSPNAGTLGATYTPTAADSLAGTITLVLTTNDPAGVCNAVNDSMQITMNQPAVANANADQTLCYGSSVTLAGLVGGSANSGSWSGGAGTFSPNNTTLNASYTPSPADSLAGSVTLVLTTNDPSGVCNAVTDTMQITVNPLPTIPVLSASGYTVCQTQTVGTITASGNGTIIWSTSPTMSPVIHTGTSYSPGTLPVGTTVYYLLDTLSTGCKSSTTASVSVTINTTPPTPTLTTTGTTFCQNVGAGTITSNGSSGTIWSTSPTLNPVINVGPSYTPAGLPVGTTTFYVADSTALGCISAGTASVSILIYPNPVLSGAPVVDSANCGFFTGSVSGISVSGGTPAYYYQWYDGTVPIANNNSPTLSNLGPGSYSVVVTDLYGCVALGGINSFTVASSSNISSSFTANPYLGTVPLNVVFTPNTTTAATYSWTLGNGSAATSTSTQTTYTTAGSYTVTLVTTNGTCTSSTSQVIVVDGIPGIVIPNIFTPNGDGINELFGIQCTGIADLNAGIYNRWGTLISTIEGVNGTWDGTSATDKTLSEGTYFVIVKAKGIDGKLYEKEGFVTLVR